jgi:hypothetical protein
MTSRKPVVDLVEALAKSLRKPEPKEIPLLLKGPLIRAFLDGRKTVTRRMDVDFWRKQKPGDLIWFRESFAFGESGGPPYFEADYDDVKAVLGVESWRWRPSIHMPKAVCRCWAEIVSIRVERLHEITDDDAIAEGVRCWVCDGPVDGTSENDCECFHTKKAAGVSFAVLWNVINSKRAGAAWEHNPIVARVEFRRVDR